MVGGITRRRVKINEKVVANSPRTDGSQDGKKSSSKLELQWPEFLEWVPKNWSWSNIKPVIRCALAAWVSLLLFLIPRVQRTFGNASYLVLIASFLSPPGDPFIATLEREILMLLFVLAAWAWACLGIKLSNLARTNTTYTPVITDVYAGRYIQAAPSVIMAIFIFLGASFFLYIKARKGPGPYIIATIFACILIDISMLTVNLFPYPYYKVAETIIIPLSFHSAITLLASLLLFPSTISSQVTTRMGAVIDPLLSSFSLHRALLSLNPFQDKEAFSESLQALQGAIAQSEGSLLPLAASVRLLSRDIIICRFAPTDLKGLQESMRRLAVRANGLTVYYTLIDPNRERFPVTPVQSHPVTPASSRHPSPERYQRRKEQDIETVLNKRGRSRQRDSSISPASTPTRQLPHPLPHQPHPHHHHHHHHHASHSLHGSLLHLSLSKLSLKRTYPVGVFESQKYLNLDSEDQMREDADSREYNIVRATELIRQSCTGLLDEGEEALKEARGWFDVVRKGRLSTMLSISLEKEKRRRKELLQRLEEAKERLEKALKEFRENERHAVLEPYLSIFNTLEGDSTDESPPPHQYLFHCYVYQNHLIQFAVRISILLGQIISLEQERKQLKLWVPARQFLSFHSWQASENPDQDDDDDPEKINGMEPEWIADLGEPRRRDPDALPPSNIFEYVMHMIWVGVSALWQGNVLFAIKAGALTVILSIPSLLSSTGGFAYTNKFYWGIFMGQLTLARFRGDTVFGFVARIGSTLFGVAVGMVLWYISTGTAYGLAIVCGVCFPFFFYVRLYWPGPQMTNLIFFVTIVLVLGFSYQDKIFTLPGSVGSGWAVAWRRFVLVVCGVTAAFLFSFLPPSNTIRVYQRVALSTTLSELGSILCSITGYALVRREDEVPEIVTSLIAVRSKLNRSILAKQNAIYEISLRGRWPSERYHKVTKLQTALAYQLSHLLTLMTFLEPAWGQALLRRTRFQDSSFQGEVLAVIAMISTSLRYGVPLPQITPCPLLERFKSRFHGLDIIHKDSEEDYGLPRLLTRETLENEQYLMFCVGVSTTFGIVCNLDRLMIAVKELVGEQYHIHGAGLEWSRGGPRGGSRAGSAAVSVDMSHKV